MRSNMPFQSFENSLLMIMVILTNIHVYVHTTGLHAGWINKAVLLPLIKACFSYNLSNPEIKSLLANEALKSMVGI